MTIDDLKRALVEVREICASNECIICPFHKKDDANVPYCPMQEDADGLELYQPVYWEIDDWEEDTHETD